ncbi:hypothetical protein [Streptomyces sp. DSM 15324]|uniref:hypothetical protein n=1 Tax=Streptomyces sp. DSM 15324 TaxID=1739111 RepID=UPI000747C599|nr:hypothetical protein [Streptomyces sp. DSM 15324]KUO13572.1 hypothetical protein AQJ58_00235 [Streptomyces sp. DSM 15324]
MSPRRDRYIELYDGDFGLSGVTESLARPGAPSVLDVVAARAEEAEGEYARDLGREVRALCGSPLSDDRIRAVLLAATRRVLDPGPGSGPRDWLRAVAQVCDARTPRGGRPQARTGLPGDSATGPQDLRGAVLAELRTASGDLERTLETSGAPVPDVVPALEQVVADVDADLGLRLLLRVLKAYSVPVPLGGYDRLWALGEELGYSWPLVIDGLNVLWPPFDDPAATRRRFPDDFGLSELTAAVERSYPEEETPADVLRRAVAADPDVPGAQAFLLLQDVSRLRDSTLSREAITALWRAATGQDLGVDGVEGRDLLRRIEDACVERLRTLRPGFAPTPPGTPPTAGTEAVLRELHDLAPALDAALTGRTSRPVQGAVSALEEVCARVDPDLGFRLLLRTLTVSSVSLTGARYARFTALGERLGLAAGLVAEAEHLVRHE